MMVYTSSNGEAAAPPTRKNQKKNEKKLRQKANKEAEQLRLKEEAAAAIIALEVEAREREQAAADSEAAAIAEAERIAARIVREKETKERKAEAARKKKELDAMDDFAILDLAIAAKGAACAPLPPRAPNPPKHDAAAAELQRQLKSRIALDAKCRRPRAGKAKAAPAPSAVDAAVAKADALLERGMYEDMGALTGRRAAPEAAGEAAARALAGLAEEVAALAADVATADATGVGAAAGGVLAERTTALLVRLDGAAAPTPGLRAERRAAIVKLQSLAC